MTLRFCLNDLFQFSMVFGVGWLAFGQLIYLVENDKSQEFSTLIKTFETTFTMILNNVPITIYSGENFFMKTIICIGFYLFIVFILLNMFITLITEKYEKARNEAFKSVNNSVLYSFMREKIQKFSKILKNNNEINFESKLEFKGSLEAFEIAFIKFNNKINDIF
ncbi:unnamed protein product [Brachionus calyciflorus]|uniref:Polycystin cation channel PKD1/PKD2 domain-containing protein n=1 Tax=Brachionus calyciflorus TaxID=104777 RepID=A0A814IW87_9BILA|nr:unnamed protein product [Brachionus calyciflorus]